MHRYDILVIGEANVDLVLSGEDVTPDFGQTEKLVEDAVLELGGSSAIFACGASRLGLDIGFAGKLGDDEFGKFLMRVFRDRGVDTAPIIIDKEIKTGLTLHLSQPHDRAMLTYLGTIASMQSNEIDVELFKRTRHVHISSFFLQKGLQKNLSYLIQKAKEANTTISIDPGWDPEEKWDGYLMHLLDQIDIFLPNSQEAMLISSTSSITEALISLHSHLPMPVIKMGRNGACSLKNLTRIEHPGFTVNNVDTTGAGDSFNAGFLYGFLKGFELEECLRWGCACGALSTLNFGGIQSQPTLSEVVLFLSDHNN